MVPPPVNEKLKPHYNLCELQKLLQKNKTRHFTRNSILGAHELDLSVTQMKGIVLSLRRINFIKSMTSDHDRTLWQDVYNISKDRIPIYIKLQKNHIGEAVVISFKKNEGNS